MCWISECHHRRSLLACAYTWLRLTWLRNEPLPLPPLLLLPLVASTLWLRCFRKAASLSRCDLLVIGQSLQRIPKWFRSRIHKVRAASVSMLFFVFLVFLCETGFSWMYEASSSNTIGWEQRYVTTWSSCKGELFFFSFSLVSCLKKKTYIEHGRSVNQRG